MIELRALILGRFQPPHRGHLRAIADAARRYELVFVGVGSAQASHTRDNPFTAGERFDMLRAALRERRLRNVHLYAIPDIHRHARWVAHVEALLPSFGVVITNNPVTVRLFRRARYRIETGTAWNRQEWSGRQIRRKIRRGLAVDDLIPSSVYKVLEGLGGFDRVRSVGGPPRDG